MANSDSLVGYSGKAVGCVRTLALYLTSLSRFATDLNSARRHHLFYELSHVTTFLAVVRHKKYFRILYFAKVVFTVTWLMLRMKVIFAICSHQENFSIWILGSHQKQEAFLFYRCHNMGRVFF